MILYRKWIALITSMILGVGGFAALWFAVWHNPRTPIEWLGVVAAGGSLGLFIGILNFRQSEEQQRLLAGIGKAPISTRRRQRLMLLSGFLALGAIWNLVL